MLRLAAFCLAIAALALFPTLPDWRWPAGAALCLFPAVRLLRSRWREAALCLACVALGLAWGGWRAELRLAQRLPVALENRLLDAVVTVRDLPSRGEFGTRLLLDVEPAEPGAFAPLRVQASDYGRQDWPPGSRWRVELKLRRAHATANRHGFDGEAWMWSEGIDGSASLRKGRAPLPPARDAAAWLDRARAALLARINDRLPDSPQRALLAALTVGAQRELGADDWALFAATGTTHLVSISGLHITLLAGLAAALARRACRYYPPSRLPPRLVVAGVALATALVYSALAGFSVPTQRTLYMLATLALMLCLRRPHRPFELWWVALAVVLVLDPFSVLAPGLWLSFGLVGALLWALAPRLQPPAILHGAVLAQWVAGVASLAPLLLWFGRFPLVSPLANAVAIPLVAMLITPLALAGLADPSGLLLHGAAWLARALFWLLQWLAQAPQWQAPAYPAALLGAALLGTALCLLPRGSGLGTGGLLLMLPLGLYRPPALAPGEAVVDVIDVGQGLALLVRTTHHALLFDTGPAPAARTVLAQLAGEGVSTLDALLLSHHDADHDAGAPALLAVLPVAHLLAGQPQQEAALLQRRVAPCVAGQSWAWDGVRFDVLAPQPGAVFAEDNAASCVLRVATRRRALLVSGDLPMAGEEALVARYGAALRADVLVLGHHGSKTSTSDAWLAASAAQHAIASAGYLNRYHHPHPSVLARLQRHGVTLWRTDSQGGVRVRLGADVVLSAWRSEAPRHWRWQAR